MKIENDELAGLNFDWLSAPVNLNAPAIAQTAVFGPPPAPVPALAPGGGWGGFLQTFADTVKQVAPGLVATAASIKMQNQLAKLNRQRAAAGQPPIDTAQYMEASAPVIKIQGGVDSGTSSTLKYVGIAAAVGLALLIVTKKGDDKK